jgi:murein L,D-transpeptidase YcbB/YkuD
MHPLFILGPVALIAWMLASKNKVAAGSTPALQAPVPAGATRASLPASTSPSANTANYIQHVQNAIDATQAMQDPYGTAGQFGPSSAATVLDATAALSDPIDTLTAQKDLNFLGADPALVEDGIMGPKTLDAIKSFQIHANLPPTGTIDPATATALRVAVATVASQSAS